ncbi:MAG: 16S rRNA (guanine(966)-N(2))-methyltransferase RsmD [Chloroflexi bacterium]|nr:16S rRNA (guanine(966)-N(2))-methyltransferase RsmD [Chloroflexota bacterium]
MSNRLRIIAGSLGGRLIEVPEEGTRPFADRVRQALFAVLEPRLPGAHVLDLCAGSGAAGIEALSRGAESVLFVDLSRRAAEVIRLNLAGLDLVARAEVRVADAGSSAASLVASGRAFDLVIADPPYDDLAVRRSILRALGATPSALAAQGLLVISGRKQKEGAAQGAAREGGSGLRLVRSLTFGETVIELYERDVDHVRATEQVRETEEA